MDASSANPPVQQHEVEHPSIGIGLRYEGEGSERPVYNVGYRRNGYGGYLVLVDDLPDRASAVAHQRVLARVYDLAVGDTLTLAQGKLREITRDAGLERWVQG